LLQATDVNDWINASGETIFMVMETLGPNQVLEIGGYAFTTVFALSLGANVIPEIADKYQLQIAKYFRKGPYASLTNENPYYNQK
jgi:hypothetical protein